MGKEGGSPSVRTSLCPYFCLSIFQTAHRSVHLSVPPSVHCPCEIQCKYIFFCLFLGKGGEESSYLHVLMSICPSVCPFIHPFICPLSVCTSVCPSVRPPIRLSIQVKTDESQFYAFFTSFWGMVGGGGGGGYLLLTWECPENEICFSIMKISHNPVEEGWGRLEKSSARPTSIFL